MDLETALAGNHGKSVVIDTKNSKTVKLEFSVVGECVHDHWTLEDFQLNVEGIDKYRIIVGNFQGDLHTVSSVHSCTAASINISLQTKEQLQFQTHYQRNGSVANMVK